jgi:hypothetical protein
VLPALISCHGRGSRNAPHWACRRRKKILGNKMARALVIVSGILCGTCVGSACASSRLHGFAPFALWALWIACGVSWERGFGGTGIVGGALGGTGGGCATAALTFMWHRDAFEMVGPLLFLYEAVCGIFIGSGLGANVWLFLGKPLVRQLGFPTLQCRDTWSAAALFFTVALFTASALLVAVRSQGRNESRRPFRAWAGRVVGGCEAQLARQTVFDNVSAASIVARPR